MFELNEQDYKDLIKYEMVYREKGVYSLLSQLSEKTYDIDKRDILLLVEPYEKLFKNINESITTKNRSIIINLVQDYLLPNRPLKTIKSKALESELCHKADELNPVIIKLYLVSTSYYNYDTRVISLGLHHEFRKLLITILTKFKSITRIYPSFYGILQDISYDTKEDSTYMKYAFTTQFMEVTAYHEISHWLHDSLTNNILHRPYEYNQEYMKKHNTTEPKYNTPAKYYHVPDMVFSNIELNAYIHGLKQWKNIIGEDKWNTLTFPELLQHDPAMSTVYNMRNNSEEHKQAWLRFKRSMILRMQREGILGKNMR